MSREYCLRLEAYNDAPDRGETNLNQQINKLFDLSISYRERGNYNIDMVALAPKAPPANPELTRSRPAEVTRTVASENANPWAQYEMVRQRNPATGAASSSSGSGVAVHFEELMIVSPDVSQAIVDRTDFSRSRSPYGPVVARSEHAESLSQSLAAYKDFVKQERTNGRGIALQRPTKDSDCGNWINPRILARCQRGAEPNNDNLMYTLLTTLLRHHETGDSDLQAVKVKYGHVYNDLRGTIRYIGSRLVRRELEVRELEASG